MAVWKLRLFNFSYFSLFSLFLSFLPVYLTSIQVSESQIGLILGVGGVIGVFSQPFWGVVSDKKKTIKKVLLAILAISIAGGFVLFQTVNLILLFVLVACMYFFFMPTDSLVESLNYQSAQRFQTPYGSIRMYGAMGYATASMIIGVVAGHFGVGSMAYLFVGYGIVAFLAGLRMEDVEAVNKPLQLHSLRQFFSEKSNLVFFLLILLLAIPHRINDTYIGIYIERAGGSLQYVGYAWFVMTLAEVAFFAIVHRFLKPGKELAIISVAGVIYALRFFLTAITDSPLVLVLLQLLQGCTFVLLYTAAIQYLYTIVPPEWKATGQTILAVLFFGISGIVASIAGGFIFEQWGGSSLYQLMAVISLVVVAFCFIMRKKQVSAQ
ncbi:MFS transporter [Brevibacillus sp. TJ4]|uniref:MFS transporter n=1 Tax=Brevibacillus sp. TJ4 TaxID=3234853 RepID=UPI003BA2066F